MRVKFKVENTTHLYMPKLNGNFTLRQILTILPYFRPDTNIAISFQSISYPGYSSACWKTERTNSRHGFGYTSQETPCKRVCFKKYASLLTMVWSKTISFGTPQTYIAGANKDPPASLDPGVTIYSHSIEQLWTCLTCAAISWWPLGSNIRLQLCNNQFKE